VNIERRGEFAVTQVVTSKQKQFRLPGGKGGEDTTHAFLFFGGGVKLFRCGDAANDREQTFIAVAPRLSTQFVDAEADGGAIEPGFRLWRVGARSVPQANKRFDGKFFGASGIADDSGDHPRNTLKLSAEERLDVEGHTGRGCRFEDDITGCVHIHITTQARYL